MEKSYVVTVGDLVIADFSDAIYIMSLATCVSFVSINFIKQKVLATHFLRPDFNPDDSSKNALAYVNPGLNLSIKQFQKETGLQVVHCQNYLIGGISEEFSQFGGKIGDLNVKAARILLQKSGIVYHEFVGGKHHKTICIKNGILTTKTTDS